MKRRFFALTTLWALLAISACEKQTMPVDPVPPCCDPPKPTPNLDTFDFDAASTAIPTSSNALIEHEVHPSAADARVKTRDESHRVVVMPGQLLRPKLVVFLPGTTDTASSATEMLRFIARGGARVIGLSYANATDVLGPCANSQDSDCIGKNLLEMLDGVDHSPIINVPDENSVETRLTKLLAYLGRTYPTEGWQHFLDEGGKLRWSHIIISGHSLGGYMAARIAKVRRVERSVALAAFGRPGDWIQEEPATDPADCYAFAHTQDAYYLTSPVNYRSNWALYKYPGVLFSIDGQSDFTGVHQMTTSIALSSGLDAHHSVILFNGKSPKNTDGTFVFAPVWKYLFDL